MVLDGVLSLLIRLLVVSVREISDSCSPAPKQGKLPSWLLNVHIWRAKQLARFCGLIMKSRARKSCLGVTKRLLGYHWSNYLAQWEKLRSPTSLSLKAILNLSMRPGLTDEPLNKRARPLNRRSLYLIKSTKLSDSKPTETILYLVQYTSGQENSLKPTVLS